MKNLNKIDFYFDCSSPWTYLAFREIIAISQRNNIPIAWYPVLVGGVFNAVNQDIYTFRNNPNPLKLKYAEHDLQLWAKLRNIEFNWPRIFPVNSVNAMRGCIYAESEGKIEDFAEEVFSAYWTHQRDISSYSLLLDIANKVGLSMSKFEDYLSSEEAKNMLMQNTQNLIDRGGFGSPTFFFDNHIFFGNDRLHLLEIFMNEDKFIK